MSHRVPSVSLALRRLSLAALILLLLPGVSGRSRAEGQNFVQPVVVPTGGWPVFLTSADMNGDGFPDLIYIDQGATATASTTHVLLNDGKGHFIESAVVATAGTSVAVGRLGQSNYPSLAWAVPSASGISAYAAPGQGDGTFPVTRSIGVFPAVIATKPIKIDYVMAGLMEGVNQYQDQLFVQDTANNVIYAFLYNPDGSFAPAAGYLPHGAGPAVIAGETSTNGRRQGGTLVVTGLATHTAQFFYKGLGLGQSNFPLTMPSYRFDGKGDVQSLLLQDVDNDGILDFIAEGPGGRIDVYKGNADGTFSTTSLGGTGALDGTTGNGGHLVAVGDFNHDGLMDAVTTTPAGMSVLLGQGTQYLGLQGIYNAGPGMRTFATADFNGDGNLDVATDSPEGIAILYGNADGSFQSGRAFATGQPALSGATGVFTSSGNVDAVVAVSSTQAQLLRGAGDGTFALVTSSAVPVPTTTLKPTSGFWSSVIVGDFNNDGPLDIAVTADGPSSSASALGLGVTVQYGKGDGSFTTPLFVGSHVDPGASPYFGVSSAGTALGAGLGAGGVPGFLNLDAAHLWSVGTPSLQNSTPFATEIAPVSEAHAHSLVTAGVLRQGKAPDAIVQNGGSLKVYLNNGASFAATPLGDLAVDGSLTTAGQMAAPDISATFPGMSKALGFHAFLGSAVIADLDNDGNGDLIVAYDNLDADHTAPSASRPNSIYLWFGSGDGRFLTSAAHPVNPVRLTPSRNYYQVAVGDLNGDGIADLILSDGYLVDVQYGKGDGSFGPENHLLAGQGVNTISTADLRHLGRTDLVVANGGTVFGNVVANREVLTPNPDVNTGGVTVLLNQVQPQAAIGTLTAVPEPAGFEAAYSLVATIGGPLGSAPPTGTVDFSVDGTAVGTAPVINGTATLDLPAYVPTAPVGTPLLPGIHTLSGLYRSLNSALGTQLTGTHTVNLGQTTVTLNLTTPLQVYYGEPIDGIVEISPQDPAYAALGTYSVLSNGVLVPGCVGLKNVSCPYGNPNLLDAGNYTLTIAYNGGPANGDPVNGSALSGPYPFVVLRDLTTATLTSSLNPATVGQPVTFSANLVGNVAVPNGTVTFYDGSAVLGAGSLNAVGLATFTTSSLAVGPHSVTAVYAGNNDFNPVTTAVVVQQIVAAVVPPPPPTGPQSFTLTVTPAPVTIGVGRTAVLLVTVTPVNGFAQPVQLSCAGTPFESACMFIQTTIPVGGGATTLDVSTMAPHNCGDPTHPYFLGSLGKGSGGTPSAPLAAALLGGIGVLLLPKRRKGWWKMFLLLAALGGLAGVSGCGNCTDLGTRPGTYSFTVTAAAQGGPVIQTATQTIKMTVTIP